MSLTKFFSMDFLIQNIKKSKAIIILCAVLLPTFTTIFLSSISSISNNVPASFLDLNIINFLTMYIIPVVLSITLFNYTFKKNSADFIGAMPISKKNIFITNTIARNWNYSTSTSCNSNFNINSFFNIK